MPVLGLRGVLRQSDLRGATSCKQEGGGAVSCGGGFAFAAPPLSSPFAASQPQIMLAILAVFATVHLGQLFG